MAVSGPCFSKVKGARVGKSGEDEDEDEGGNSAAPADEIPFIKHKDDKERDLRLRTSE